MVAMTDGVAALCWWQAAAAGLVLLLVVAVAYAVFRRVTRRRAASEEQPHPQPQSKRGFAPHALGVGAAPQVRNVRRYHSITVLSETTPLLMETGADFFGPPPRPRRSSSKQHQRSHQRLPRNVQYTQAGNIADSSRNVRYTQAGATADSPRRRVFTAPGTAMPPVSLMRTLHAAEKGRLIPTAGDAGNGRARAGPFPARREVQAGE
ncbi:hypothetical protein GGF46_003956 [Coemansia sp. RSA 552]|nr:hypothetical protein GGF46_003956 [Coemansia sp. RSA 552]